MNFQVITAFFLFIICGPLRADQVMVLSGGGSPASNHYSQYLQAKVLSVDLQERFPDLALTVMFGAGNRSGDPAVLADVRRSPEMLPGFISGNRPATEKSVMDFFESVSLKKMNTDETLFLLVGGHGLPQPLAGGGFDLTFSNNCIDLWGFEADLHSGKFTEAPAAARCLSKDRLQSLLHTQVSAGRVVFAMSQCFSGGFHQMSVSHKQKYPSANPRICGFTSSAEDTIAAGCTADVESENFQGYERSLTEQLTGIDLPSGRRLRPARQSLQEAHQEATVEDLTGDIPLATSDYYLWKWALAIQAPAFVPRTSAITAKQARLILRNAKIGAAHQGAEQLNKKNSFFARVKQALDRYPEYRRGINGPLENQQRLEQKLGAQLAELVQASNSFAEPLEASEELLYEEWNKFVRQGHSQLSPSEADIEIRHFTNPLPEPIALMARSIQTITEPAMARALADYETKREDYALKWAAQNRRKDLKELAQAVRDLQNNVDELERQVDEMRKRHGHIRRLLIYRQVLGAWQALEQMNDLEALRELEGLLECESTPF